ncbi:hypothetical protein BCV69DRAFT_100106 [Microstroma glucosiphilum]|uniref:Uncharacterized protein n=1 Tax=Pseudomicrostroma glucosiphilum TaxID=1684307 RepID=A0A316UI72_9BASI|nr:hypothetical protein BCV69DRAFT_100106 [Pseudomicrostroma glucosiphilum]PWN22885.1 hypothetical protein BCV69DRAFT_100106 [Pseudomicrostroma glucosiphilum]
MSTSPNSWARTAAVADLQYFPSRPQPQLSCFLMLVSFPLRSDSPLCGGDERCEGGASDFSPTVARAGGYSRLLRCSRGGYNNDAGGHEHCVIHSLCDGLVVAHLAQTSASGTGPSLPVTADLPEGGEGWGGPYPWSERESSVVPALLLALRTFSCSERKP